MNDESPEYEFTIYFPPLDGPLALPCYADTDAQAVEILLASLPPLPAKRSWWRRLLDAIASV